MLAYAASRSTIARRSSSPNAMLVIIGAHVAAVAVLMSAKIDLPPRIFDPPTTIELIPAPKPPPPQQIEPRVPQPPINSAIDRPPRIIPTPTPGSSQTIDTRPALPDFDDLIGSRVDPRPRLDPLPVPTPVKVGPQLLTPMSELKPPYPHSKLLTEEEAVLRLRLAIDERGRVVAVEPVGRADPVFLAAARRHLLTHWRYRPAHENGRAVGSSAVITLRFELDG